MWRRGELSSEHRSNEDNCAILSTDRTREDAVSLESPTEGITTAFFTCENPHRIDDLHAPLVLPCFRDKYLPNGLDVFTLVLSVRCSVVIASVKLITIVFIALLVYEHYYSTSPLRCSLC